LIKEAVKFRDQTSDFGQFRKGIKAAVNQICRNVDLMSKKVVNEEEVKQIALVSSNFD